jgi:threonine/homoserine/homoserine lactone efflux protein
MLAALLLGSGFGFAAAIQPGPLQAYLLSSVAQHGWRRTLPAALTPILSDGPIILIVLLVLTRMPDNAARILQAAGGLLLLYFAWLSYRGWRRGPTSTTEEKGTARGTLLGAMGINLLNPNPWLGWTLILGPALISAWGQSPAWGVALLVSFYGVIISMTAAIILLFGTSRFLNPQLRHTLILVSAIILAALGVYRLVEAISGQFIVG